MLSQVWSAIHVEVRASGTGRFIIGETGEYYGSDRVQKWGETQRITVWMWEPQLSFSNYFSQISK